MADVGNHRDQAGLRTRPNFIRVRVQLILARPSSSSNSLIYLFLSSTKITCFAFKFEFWQLNIPNQNNFFTTSAHAIKKMKIFCLCSRFNIGRRCEKNDLANFVRIFSYIYPVSQLFS